MRLVGLNGKKERGYIMELVYSYAKHGYVAYYPSIDYDAYDEYEEEMWYI